MTHLVELGFLRANLKKLILITVIYIIITNLSSLILMNNWSTWFYSSVTGLVFAPGLMIGYILLIPGCYCMSAKLFGYLMKRNESDFYETLPYKRKTMYRMNMVAMYIVIALVFVINVLFVFVSTFFVRSHRIIWLGSFKYMLAAVIVMILITNISSFAMACSCNLRMAVLMTILLIVGPRFIITSVAYTGDLANGSMHLMHFVRILNPDINILSRAYGCIATYDMETPESLQNVSMWMANAYTALLALGYYILGERVYVKRKSENAGTCKVGMGTYYFNKIFLGVIIMIIPVLDNLNGPEIANEEGINVVSLFIFAGLAIFTMAFYDFYIEHKFKKLKSLRWPLAVVLLCLLVVIIVVQSIKNYELDYELDPDGIEGYCVSRYYGCSTWETPSSEIASKIKYIFEKQKDKTGYDKAKDGYIFEDYKYGSARYFSQITPCIMVKYKGKVISLGYSVEYNYWSNERIDREISDAYYSSDAYISEVYGLPDKITRHNGRVIARVKSSGTEVELSPKAYETFRDEYYNLDIEDRQECTYRTYCKQMEEANILVICEEMVDGISKVRRVGITEDDFPETYEYVLEANKK